MTREIEGTVVTPELSFDEAKERLISADRELDWALNEPLLTGEERRIRIKAIRTEQGYGMFQLLLHRRAASTSGMTVELVGYPGVPIHSFSNNRIIFHFADEFGEEESNSTNYIDFIGTGRGGAREVANLIGIPDIYTRESPRAFAGRTHDEIRHIERTYKRIVDLVPDIGQRLMDQKFMAVRQFIETATLEKNSRKFDFVGVGYMKNVPDEGGVILELDLGRGNNNRFFAEYGFLDYVNSNLGVTYFNRGGSTRRSK